MKKADWTFKLNGVSKIFENDSYVAYVFDCNGDPPWDIADAGTFKMGYKDVVAIETNYLDGDEYWSRAFNETGEETAIDDLVDFMKAKLSKQEYSVLKKKAEYSIKKGA